MQAWEIWFIQQFQSMGEWLTPIMKLFTWLGYPQAYIVLIAIVYWSIDRKMGVRMAIFLTLVSSVNSILKQILHAPRPYWSEPGIKGIQGATGFGMPSGHAQAATVWLLIGTFIKKTWFWIIAVIMVTMIGMSRTYLGVHSPGQVMIGWLIGAVFILFFFLFESRTIKWFRHLTINIQILLVTGLTAIIVITGSIFVVMLKSWEIPVEWITNASVYLEKGDTLVSSIGMKSVLSNAGGFLGSAIGAILINKIGGFEAHGVWWKRILRCVTGLGLVVLLYAVLLLISPDEQNEIMYNLWRFFAFFVTAFSILFLIPLLFLRIKL